MSKKEEIVTVKMHVLLEKVMFEPKEDSELYIMTLPTPNRVSFQTEVTEETKKKIEKLIMERTKNNEDD